MPKKANPLVGKYFHLWRDGKINKQGQIVSVGPDGYFFVILFNWFDGGTTGAERLLSFDELQKDGTFYGTAKQMRYAQYYHEGLSEEDIKCNESFIRDLSE